MLYCVIEWYFLELYIKSLLNLAIVNYMSGIVTTQETLI